MQIPDKNSTDHRLRFFIGNDVRGDIVRLSSAYQSAVATQPYPLGIKQLLGEMMVAAALLISTFKMDGKISVQLSNTADGASLSFALGECDSMGRVRGSANFDPNADFATLTQAWETGGVLFIDIRPDNGARYQGIVERVGGGMGAAIAHYQLQSMQIATHIMLSCDGTQAAGILLQKLPSDDDADLWARTTTLASTLSDDELLNLPSEEILYRLFHQESVRTAPITALHFGCDCSLDKSMGAILQIGKDEALEIIHQDGQIALDCGFCGQVYRFDKAMIQQMFTVN